MKKWLSVEEIQRFRQQHPQVTEVDVLLADINGILRGKRMRLDKIDSYAAAGLAVMPLSMGLQSIAGNAPPVSTFVADIAFGDPDYHCRGQAKTLRVNHSDRGVLGIGATSDDGLRWHQYDPRRVLDDICERIAPHDILCTIELEFYLFGASALGEKKHGQCYGIEELTQIDTFLQYVTNRAAAIGLALESISKEYGSEQFEITTLPTTPQQACWDVVMLRWLVRQVAQECNMEATFMAKPYAHQVGNGMHVNVSLWQGRDNIFFDKVQQGPSQQCMHAIAGLQQLFLETVLVCAPHVNSYKRFAVGNYAPINASWAVNSRHVALRLPLSNEQSMRLEHRVAGADANPYLVLAAVLAGIDAGMQCKKMPLAAGKYKHSCHGIGFETALLYYRRGKTLKQYWQHGFHNLFAKLRQWEWQQYSSQVSSTERNWYSSVL